MTDEQIIEIGKRYFREGHKATSVYAFVLAVRECLAAAYAPVIADTAGAKPVNQCDGCRVNAPMNRPLMHTMPDGGFMACTAYRYASPAIDAAPDDARITQLQTALETALEFIADATIIDGQWHWVEEARAALNPHENTRSTTDAAGEMESGK